jgi:hypothetical protein
MLSPSKPRPHCWRDPWTSTPDQAYASLRRLVSPSGRIPTESANRAEVRARKKPKWLIVDIDRLSVATRGGRARAPEASASEHRWVYLRGSQCCRSATPVNHKKPMRVRRPPFMRRVGSTSRTEGPQTRAFCTNEPDDSNRRPPACKRRASGCGLLRSAAQATNSVRRTPGDAHRCALLVVPMGTGSQRLRRWALRFGDAAVLQGF